MNRRAPAATTAGGGQQAPMPAPAPARDTPVRVVIADDHPGLRTSMTSALSDDDTVAVVAAVGAPEQVHRAATDFDPHVAVLSFRLPHTSGPELCLALRERFPRVRVIVSSVHPRESALVEAFGAGARGYVLKDSAPTVLRYAVRAVADGGRFVDPRVAGTLVDLAMRGRRAKGPYGLTLRELRVLEFLPRGFTNSEIARELGIADQTVKTHVRHILRKLDARDRFEAAALANRRGLT